jgi:hypothetical protein
VVLIPNSFTHQFQYINWKNENLKKDNTLIPTYYFITKYNNQRVARSKTWFANIRDDIKKTWEIIIHLQKEKEYFEKYKDSIHRLKSKAFYEKYETTNCDINDNISTFVLNGSGSELESDEDQDLKKELSEDKTICLID